MFLLFGPYAVVTEYSRIKEFQMLSKATIFKFLEQSEIFIPRSLQFNFPKASISQLRETAIKTRILTVKQLKNILSLS